SGSICRSVNEPRRSARIPQAGVDDLGVARIDDDVDGADAVVRVEDLLPCLAAVLRSIDAAIGMGTVEVTKRGDEHHVGVARVHGDTPDLPRGLETDARPGLPRVERLVDPVAEPDRVAHVSLAGPDVHDVGARGS